MRLERRLIKVSQATLKFDPRLPIGAVRSTGRA
jgi:hypothetical protein